MFTVLHSYSFRAYVSQRSSRFTFLMINIIVLRSFWLLYTQNVTSLRAYPIENDLVVLSKSKGHTVDNMNAAI